jgi:hypothetical protein
MVTMELEELVPEFEELPWSQDVSSISGIASPFAGKG